MSLRADKPIIYLITNGEAADSNFAVARREILDIVRVAVEEKVSLIQLREKKLSARTLFELTVAAAEITRGSATCLLVNDRADISFAAGADGVHLAANSLPAGVIRKNFPPEFIVGVSTHTLETAVSAASDGADFVVFGPVFETPGKGAAKGIESLHEVCDRVKPFPVLAIGGVDAGCVDEILGVGASGVAAIRALNDADSMRVIVQKVNSGRSA